MKPLYTQEHYKNSNSEEKLPFECYHCKNIFFKKKKYITHEIKTNKGEIKFCSQICNKKNRITRQNVICLNCKKEFEKTLSKINDLHNNFCSSSCNATYQNTHKTNGYRRSKLEIWLEKELTILYPDFEIHFNRKDTIQSELDIYIPSLNIAFELNGIFHYEPIYGSDKLTQIQNNDNRKFQACLENNISLCIIDSSGQKKFTELSSKKYLDIITNIIKERLLTS